MTDAKEYLRLAKQYGNPVIETDLVTWVWEGNSPPVIISDKNNWMIEQADPFAAHGSSIWTFQTRLPEDAYFEYAFVIQDQRIPDPLNSKRTPNGIGKFNNYFFMPGKQPTPWTKKRPTQTSGLTIAIDLPTFGLVAGKKRSIHFYKPATEQPVPLLVVWDGLDYLRRARIVNMVDALTEAGLIQPMALALIPNGKSYRAMEYMCSEATLGFLVQSVIPAARERINLLDTGTYPGGYGVLGASLGGLMALYTALRMPGIFGKVLSQSGAFSIDQYDMVVWDLLRLSENSSVNIWMDAGSLEWLLPANNRMAQFLKEYSYTFQYHTYHGGHNYPCWRDDLADGLQYLFGGKNH